MTALTAVERETIIIFNDTSDDVLISTTSPVQARRFRADPRFTETGVERLVGGGETVFFSIPKAEWNPLRGAKHRRKPLTPEQRQQRAETLAKARGMGGAK